MKRGIVRTAFGMLRRRPALLCFPAMNVAALAAVLAAAWVLPLNGIRDRALDNQTPTTTQTVGLFALLALLSCVGTYFTAALLHSVRALLADDRPTIRASLGAMLRRMPTLACWSVLGNTVGVLLQIAESTAGVSWLFDMAGLSWSLLTYFALPVLVAEGSGLLTALRRSLALGRRELGAQVAGFARVFLTTVLVAVVGVAALILAVETDDVAVMLAAAGGVVVLWLLTGIASSTLSGIYRMSLYHRASATPLPPSPPFRSSRSALPAAQVGFRP
ncbi:DUF6159 family protein [Streptomyces sp. UNOB3_S3]|uniref:DUF6159 family protein n=1 Tax=Streptomyces sp. UNOB3_S3 TaxID=2871682 RepID=UPI001E5C7EB3|nr:DUF6159 family protein [Streptomyces sp. UNOB3_S3]MCC3778160.1 hypothetical protein [Streptomyces sp. UNOB3_S3]